MIDRIEVRRAVARLREPFVTSRGAIDVLTAIECTLVDTEGLRGVGWASPATRLTGQTLESIEQALAGPIAKALRGAPASEPEELHALLAGCAASQPAARAAADLALHDLLARRRGVTLAALLGAPGGRVRTDVTVSAAGPAQMACAAAQRIAAGFDVLKLKVGDGDDLARITAVAGVAAEAAALRVDANQGWSTDEAVRLLDALQVRGIELEFVEQPVAAHDLDGMARVRARSPYPVMADESAGDAAGLRRLIDAGAADMVNIKLARLGGIGPAIEAAATARQAGLPCMVGSMLELPGAVAASALVASTLPWDGAHDLDAAWWLRPEDEPPGGRALRYDPPDVVICLG